METVFLDGRFCSKSEAHISVDDRGFIFGDGAYEVVRRYDGIWFEAEAHFARLRESLRKLRITCAGIEDLPGIAGRLARDNDSPASDTKLYVQVTRGAAPRSHRFPDPSTPATLFASVSPLKTDPDELEHGIHTISVGDQRWARCDIKSIALLPNILAHQRAIDAGAKEAIFVKDGMITEATYNSVFAVIDGTIRTFPLTNSILPSVTRRVVVEICAELNLRVAEFPFSEEEMRGAEELFVAGTASEVTPVVSVDGIPIADSRSGKTTRLIQESFVRRTHRR